jgi:enoyl-CoA hydratase/carnithine racemase
MNDSLSKNATSPCLNLQIDGAIARITFNNPTARNAMTWPMYVELKSICDALAINPSVRVTIFEVLVTKHLYQAAIFSNLLI